MNNVLIDFCCSRMKNIETESVGPILVSQVQAAPVPVVAVKMQEIWKL